jgi:hydrogenase maturation factor
MSGASTQCSQKFSIQSILQENIAIVPGASSMICVAGMTAFAGIDASSRMSRNYRLI